MSVNKAAGVPCPDNHRLAPLSMSTDIDAHQYRRRVDVITSFTRAQIKRAKLCRLPAYDCCDEEDAAN
jgi:hypothetical protein